MNLDKRCLLIVDDETRIRRALKDFFGASGFCVLEAADGEEGLQVFCDNNTAVDLILLDVMMPKMDGFTMLKELREFSMVPVIMLTAKGEEYDQISGFVQGADDYVSKPFSPSLLLLRVEAMLKRVGKDVDQDIVIGPIHLSRHKRSATLKGETLNLTRREFDLLTCFALNRDLTVTREQLLDNVWGYNFDGDMRTIDTHVKQLRIKLGEYGSWIKTIYRVGYCFEVPKDEA